MTTPFKDGYAFGLQVYDALGRKIITHSGEINGFAGRLTYFPETDITLVVLANMNPAATDVIAMTLNQLMHGDQVQLTSDLTEIPVALELLARYTGVYEDPQGRIPAAIALEEDRLVFKYEQRWDTNQIVKMHMQGKRPPESGPAEIKILMFASSKDKFFIRAGNIRMEFILNETGKATGMVVNQSGREITLKRAGDSNAVDKTQASGKPYFKAELYAADKKMLADSWSGMLKGSGGRELGNQELKFETDAEGKFSGAIRSDVNPWTPVTEITITAGKLEFTLGDGPMKYRGGFNESEITGFLINESGMKFGLNMTKGN